MILAFLCGFGTCALLVFAYEAWTSRPRRFVQRGNYRDARSPFRIESRGPEPVVERPETLIAREARRAIGRGEALPPYEEFERLLNAAVQHHGTPDDIPAWADRLAHEVGKMND